MTTKDSPSVPLSTRDPNQTESERIKARFDRDFLPKYGSLWRQIQEKKNFPILETINTVSNPRRVLNFADAIERKETVTINISTLHQDQKCQEEKCDCPTPIEDFVIEQQENANHTIDLTAEEPINRVGESSSTENVENVINISNFRNAKNAEFIDSATSDEENKNENEDEDDDDDDDDEDNHSSYPLQSTVLKFDLSRLEITPEKGKCVENDINDGLDTENEADDEHGSETDDEEEHEWIPDSKLKPSYNVDSIDSPMKRHTKPIEPDTIDLCDSSSYDNGGYSDFTVAEDTSDDHDDTKPVSAKPKMKTKTVTSKAVFRKNRDRITNSAFKEFNQDVFGSKLGSVEVLWSNKLNTTAGRTILRKCKLNMTPGVPLKRLAIIELSTKVIDDEARLRETLLHELVHAAVWIFEGVSKPPHGADFKRWAKIAMKKCPDVVVTTTHQYEINYKFTWRCVDPGCSFIIGRHSRSVDVVRHRCGQCRSKLIEISSDGAPKKPPSAYNLFVKENSNIVRERLINSQKLSKAHAHGKPTVKQSDVLQEVGRLWREQKNANK
jgi:predicted SprT family Zn-dependent metalloprotease